MNALLSKILVCKYIAFFFNPKNIFKNFCFFPAFLFLLSAFLLYFLYKSFDDFYWLVYKNPDYFI